MRNPYVCRDEWDRWAGESIDQLRADVERVTAELAEAKEQIAEYEAAAVGQLRSLIESHFDAARGEWSCVAERDAMREVVEATDGFWDHFKHGQPGVPGTAYPMTYEQLDAWHDEYDRWLAVLGSAVTARRDATRKATADAETMPKV